MKIIKTKTYKKAMEEDIFEKDDLNKIEANYQQLIDAPIRSISNIDKKQFKKVFGLNDPESQSGLFYFVEPKHKDIVLGKDGKIIQIRTKKSFNWKI